MNRLQVQLGFGLILLAFLGAFAIPQLANPRLGLAAHTAGIMGGIVVIAVGALAGSFTLAPRSRAVMEWSWVYAAYGNWAACLLGGITGASRLTPIAGAGTSAGAPAEALVSGMLASVAAASVIGGALAVWGMRQIEASAAAATSSHAASS